MTERKQLFLFGHALPGNGQPLIDRIQGCFKHHNSFGSEPVKALNKISADNIKQMVVGPSHICFLFESGQVGRLAFDIEEAKLGSAEKSSGNPPSGSNAAAGGPGSSSSSAPGGGPSSSSGSSVSNAYSAAASRTAKFRRVMMAARRPAFGERAGVIVDRARPLVPASQIPEELIAQAQVVLQGKSREVIVRELQRTNMNVNEAVNNLLSRDDDEGDDGGEQYLPEELLSLLDAGLRSEAGGAALIDADAFYSGSDFDYLVARDAMSRRRGDKDKKDKGKDGSGEAVQQQFVFDDHVMFWAGSERAYPSNVQRFTYIAPTYSQLFALADNGHMYAWKWDETQGQTEAHPRSVQLLGYPAREERIETFTTSSWRVVVRTNKNRVGTFLDDYFGIKMQSTMNFPLQALPDTDAKIISIHACSSLAVARTTDGIYWCGMYPYNERRKNWDRMKSRNKKHVTFDVNEITVGSEVRTKSHPIYLAGSVAINFSTGTPMVGVLMESGWTLDELCRFRLYTPEQYDSLNVATVVDPKAANFNISVRKRAAPSDESSSAAPSHGSETAGSVSKSSQKESAWSLNEVVFIHEEKFNDTAIVKLIDGAYCAVVYKRQDGSSNKESDDDVSKLRLLRKDELVLVSPNKTPRSPESFQRSFAKIPTPEAMTGSRVSSIVVDDTGVRLLCEKRARHHLLRVSVSGKLFSDHILPWNNAAFEGCGKKPEVTNYGDEFFLMIRDGNGSVVPMLRNAVGGYREPAYMGASNVRQFAIGVRHMETPFPNFTPTTVVSSVPFLAGTATKSTGTAKTPTRLGITVMLVTPQASSKNDTKALNVEDPSLMQVIMHADIRALDQLLSRYGNCKDDAFLKKEILDARADGNRTIIHAAVMNAFATNNKDQADTDNISLTKLVDSNAITKAADDTKKSYDDKWNKMIAPTKLADQTNEIAEYISAALDDSDPRKLDAEFNAEETVPTAISICPVNEAKARQLNSIEILKKLLCHNAIQHYLEDLLSVKDILGYTPLLSAINYRAYTAAAVIFNSLQNIYAAGRSRYSSLTDLVLPPGGNTRIDDSPLFMLCYNDTCSFTWTGEEHINQDIFECRTCGLVGSLCCCTECAYTCHRNHDCKLKRTSPTAYCDCWEKCPCKALAAGNQNRREWLWGQLIEKTNLVHKLNSRGEHIMLFLARTVGRQSQEQGAFSSKRRKPPTRAGATTSAESPNFPDHDLEPPKFARQALSQCLGNWKMVRSLLIYGIKSVNSYDDAKITDDSFHLFSQHGSSQLDKFTFTLLSKCTEEHLDVMLATLIQELNTKNEERDPDIVKLVSRFIRSVTRCFTLVVSSSASAAAAVFASLGANCSTGTLASSRSQSSASLNSNPLADAVGRRIGGVTLSGLMQIVRSSAQPSQKELRKRNITAIVLKCRRVFQTLPTISAIELANCADSVIAPVCLGVVKPTYHVAKGSGTSDVLDQIEKHLNSEHDLSAAFTNAKSDESVPATPGRHRRRRIGSRRDTERERDERENGVAVVDESEEYDSDSDGEAQSSRRLYSQSSAAGVEEVVSESVERVAQDFNAMDEERLSSDSITSISDDDDDDDNDDDDGDDDDDLMDADDDNQAVEDGYEDENVDDEEDDDADNAEDEEEDEGEDNGFNFRGNEDEASAGTDAMDVGEASESDRQGSAEARQEDAAPADGSSSTDAAADASGSDRNSNQEPLEVVVDDDDTIDNAPQLASDPPRSQRRQNTSSSSRGAAVRQRHAATRQTPSLLALASRDTTRRRGRTNTVAHTEDQGSILAPPSLTWAVRHVDFGNGSSSSRSFDRLFGSARRRSGANGESAPSGEETTAEAETTTPANTTSTSATYTSRAAKTRGSTEADDATPAQADAQLAMAFGILTKLIGDLLLQLTNHRAFAENKSEIGECLEVKEFEVLEVIMKDIQGRFVHVWQWLERVLDRVEAQLRFGNSIMSSSVSHMLKSHEEKKDEGDRKHRGKSVTVAGRRVEVNTRKSSSSDEPASNRKDFMTYMLTLMRGHSSENGDELPCIEIATLKPVAMVAEAYLYMHNVMDKLTTRVEEYRRDNDEMDVDVVASPNGDDPNPALQSQRKFFRRSNSISFPGMSYHDAHHVFKYATEQVLPLAVRPYLLHPNVEKMEIFEMSHPLRSRKDHLAKSKEHGNALPNYQGLVNPPTQCEQLLGGTTEQQIPKGARRVTINESSTNSPTPAVDCLTVADVLSTEGSPMNSPAQKRLDRWYLSLMLVSRAFHQDLLNNCGGDFPSSVLLRELSGFSIRDTHFRKQMEKYKSVQTRDLTLEVVRERHTLIAQTIRQINSQYTRYSSSNSTSASGSSASRPTLVIGRRIAAIQSSNSEAANNSPPLAVHKVKVTFRDEPGEGSGVARSFYSAFAEALAQMTHLPVMRNPTGSGGDAPAAPPAPGSQVNEIDDCKPLFFKPAKSGFWSPNPGTLSSGRINAFRNVGRIIGICLVQTEIFPFNLCRHVLKFILGRPITWYDLAFYDPELFNSLRNLIFNDEDDGDQTAEYYDLLSLSFSLDDPHEAGALIHLKPGGENIPVTKENVVEYLYLFVQDRLLGRHLQCLEAMRQGVFDVLPPNALDALTAEDLRLILCGAQEVSMSLMQSYTVWHNESQATNEEQEKFKQWFWSITSKFTQQEKQDLIFFWTGSPTLPSSEESFQPAPSIMLRPTDNQHLPTANTCISRLYLPHYSSKRVLRSKLLLAIKTRNFGFV